jgi:hypothetical protein
MNYLAAPRLVQRFTSKFLLATLTATLCLVYLTAQQQVSAACAALPTDKGTVTQSVSLTAGTYTVWSRLRTDTPANNSYYMNIDNAGTNVACGTVMGGTSLTANTWTWVKQASTITVSTTGTYTMTMAGKDDGVEVDRVIITGDSSCTPDNTAVQISGVNYYGENCAPSDTTAPVVTVTSPASGGTVSGATMNVTGNITDATSISNISAYLDGSATVAGTDSTPSTGAYTVPVSVSGLSVGNHTVVVKATDAEGNIGASSSVTFVIPDTTAPTISAISVGSITQTSATVIWTTDEAADSQVEYGTTTSYGTSTTLNTTKVTSHSVNVSGLSASTLYHYRVKSKDAAGNLRNSADGTFTTSAPAPDTTAPTVSMTAPTNGSTITTGSSTLTATASDNVGVVGVQFQVNNVNQGAEDTSSPYSLGWTTSSLTNGTYTIKAIARDAAGNVTTSTAVTVTVNNPAFLPEDINQSGHVDLQDFSILSLNFNRTTAQLTNARADINGDGTVNLLDFSRLAIKFGT